MCDDVWDVKIGHGLVDGMNGVERGNVVDVVKEYVVVESGIVDGVNDDESAAKIEIVIVVHVEDVEVVWSDVGIWNDVNVGRNPIDRVRQKID